jgi:hypothetical protein
MVNTGWSSKKRVIHLVSSELWTLWSFWRSSERTFELLRMGRGEACAQNQHDCQQSTGRPSHPHRPHRPHSCKILPDEAGPIKIAGPAEETLWILQASVRKALCHQRCSHFLGHSPSKSKGKWHSSMVSKRICSEVNKKQGSIWPQQTQRDP